MSHISARHGQGPPKTPRMSDPAPMLSSIDFRRPGRFLSPPSLIWIRPIRSQFSPAPISPISKLQRSTVLQHFLHGHTKYTVAHVIQLWFAHKFSKSESEWHLAYSTTTDYTAIKSATTNPVKLWELLAGLIGAQGADDYLSIMPRIRPTDKMIETIL